MEAKLFFELLRHFGNLLAIEKTRLYKYSQPQDALVVNDVLDALWIEVRLVVFEQNRVIRLGNNVPVFRRNVIHALKRFVFPSERLPLLLNIA